MTRRRYRVMEACGACGRMVSDEQLANHERICPAWRRKEREDREMAVEEPLEPKGATGQGES